MLKFLEKTDSKADTKILLEAISKDKVHLARFILDALDGKIVDAKSEGEHTPLISTVFLPDARARAKFMNLLLQKGANVNQQDESGRTALSHACEKGYLDAVKTLVKNNADPEVVDAWGNTALMYAAVAGHSLVVEFLVRSFKRLGLQIDRENKVGNSAVEVAKYLGHTECLTALMCSSKKAHDQDALAERFGLLRGRQNGEALDDQRRKSSSKVSRKKYSNIWSRMMSMDSIEELEKESKCEKEKWLASPQGFSGVLTPRLPQSCRVTQNLKQVEENCLNRHLPPLNADATSPTECLPKLLKNSDITAGDLSGPLGILITPIGKTSKDEARNLPSNFSAKMFDDSYYRKRCSLPTSTLGSALSEQLFKPSRKGKPAAHAEDFSALSVLSNRLLRRFTLPELKKSGKQTCEENRLQDVDCEATRAMQRSETFPLSTNHPQVGSKPSIDSISAVKCEFDFQLKAAPSKNNFRVWDRSCGTQED